MQTKIWVLIATIVAVMALVAGSLYVIDAPSRSGYGTLAVAVHDAPCKNCSHVWVTFTSVSVHASNSSGGGWTTLNVSGTTMDLLALNGSALAKLIGVLTLRAGAYEQVRLNVADVTVVLGNGTSLVATVPNSNGNFDGAFNVTSGGTTALSVDIDLQSSLHIVPSGSGVRAIFTPHIGSIEVT